MASPVSRLAIKTRFFSKTPHPRINDGSEGIAGCRFSLVRPIIDPGVGGLEKSKMRLWKKPSFYGQPWRKSTKNRVRFSTFPKIRLSTFPKSPFRFFFYFSDKIRDRKSKKVQNPGCGVFEKPKMQHEKNRRFWGVDIFTKWLRNLFVPVDVSHAIQYSRNNTDVQNEN